MYTKTGKNPWRPNEYKSEYVDKVKEYLDLRQDEELQVVKTINHEKGVETFENKLKVRIPTIEGFAKFIGVSKQSLYRWEKEKGKEEFKEAMDDIRQEQHQRVLDCGLSGDYNPTIAKLILSNNHGYAEKTRQESESTTRVFIDNEKAQQVADKYEKELENTL